MSLDASLSLCLLWVSLLKPRVFLTFTLAGVGAFLRALPAVWTGAASYNSLGRGLRGLSPFLAGGVQDWHIGVCFLLLSLGILEAS